MPDKINNKTTSDEQRILGDGGEDRSNATHCL